jgi:hypothetical protein
MRPILIISTIVVVFSLTGQTNVSYIGVVYKLRLQEEVGRYKNVNFYQVETVNKGGLVVKKSLKPVNVVVNGHLHETKPNVQISPLIEVIT